MIYLILAASEEDRDKLLIRKFEQCCILFNFKEAHSNLIGKETKRQVLIELVDYITTTKDSINEDTYPYIFKLAYFKNMSI